MSSDKLRINYNDHKIKDTLSLKDKNDKDEKMWL